MNCKFCGTENPDEAVFCKSCGKRLDGKLMCPACGKIIEGDSAFCNYCGKRIAGGQEIEAVTVSKPANNGLKTVNAIKAINYTKAAAVLATAVFSLIFVFLMGYSIVLGGFSENNLRETIYLYHYFGDGYNILSEMMDSVGNIMSGLAKVSMYTPVVFGTLISSIVLITVFLSSLFAIVFSIKYLMGKNESDGAGFALTAFVIYITGSLLLLALNNYYYKSTSYFTFVNTLRLNDATIAGVVLCSVSVATYTVSAIISRGRELAKKDVTVRFILSLISVVLIVVVLAVASLPAYGIKSDEFSYSDKLSVGIMTVITSLAVMCGTDQSLKIVENSGAVYTLAFFAFIMLISLAVVAACMLAKNIKCATENNNKKSALALSIAVVSLAVLFLLFSILAAQEFVTAAEYAGGGEIFEDVDAGDATFTYAVPIVIFIFSMLTLGINIAHYCVEKKQKV